MSKNPWFQLFAWLLLATIACNAPIGNNTENPPIIVVPTPIITLNATTDISQSQTPIVAPTLTLPGNNNATIPAPTTIPLQFAPGTTGTLLENKPLVAGQTIVYTVEAAVGQRLTAGIYPFSTTDSILLTVVGEDGTVLQGKETIQTGWAGILPSSQTYLLSVINLGNSTTYTLDISIPRRLKLEAGSSEIVVNGAIAGFHSTDYLLAGTQGQTLSVHLTIPVPNVFLTIVGEDGSPLLRRDLGQISFSAPLHATQDYTISVSPVIEPVNSDYSLKIILK